MAVESGRLFTGLSFAMKFRLFLVALFGLLLASVVPAQAQIAISRYPTTGPVLGEVTRSSSPATFSIALSGAVTRTSGDAIRVSSASVTPTTITISCGFLNLDNLCALRQVRVSIQPVTSSNAQITKFTVGSLTGNLLFAGIAPPAGSSVTFDLKPLGLLGTGSFVLGFDVWVSGGLSSAVYPFDYIVTATFI